MLQSLGTEVGDELEGAVCLGKSLETSFINSEPHHVAVTVGKSQSRTSHTVEGF